jgi:2TM domain
MADDDIQVAGSSEEELRKQAISSLKKKQNFRTSLAAYVIVNALLVVIWALSDNPDHFWPIWVIGGWGIGLAFQAYDAYGRRSTVSESQISEEMNRIRSG